MKQSNRSRTLVRFDSPRKAVTRIDIATGAGSSLAGLRRIVAELRRSGAGFGELPGRYPAEWSVLSGHVDGSSRIAAVALSASERRLHRESEQLFRVLAVGAKALCEASEDLDTEVVVHGVGRTDLPTLRGLVRASEYSVATGRGRLFVESADAADVEPVVADVADCHDERVKGLRLLGLDVQRADLRTVGFAPSCGQDEEGKLFDIATGLDGSARDRIAAALAYSRLAFYSANWEGMAIVAGTCLPLSAQLSDVDFRWLTEESQVHQGSGHDQAIEFEPSLLRHPGDVRGFLLKVLGIQATFRDRQDDAIRFFRAIHSTTARLSPQTRAQAHLYTALTLTKRQNQLAEAVAELDLGHAAVAHQSGEEDSIRRERGWWHNLRGLTLFRQGDLGAALNHEKSALECIEGLTDASSIHLRINLVSNISVLQESAGKAHQALQTWNRFENSGFGDQITFVKHHAYRSGGLRVKTGDLTAGLTDLRRSLRYCVELADDFHECEIATEIGGLLLDRGESEPAAESYAQASAAATRLGDPYRMALSQAGIAAAQGRTLDARIGAVAAGSRTVTERAQILAEACRQGSDPDALLPRPRTKLNRPFDLINL